MKDEDTIVTYDFVNTFPFWTWVSSWSHDDSYPKGFRYKILSTQTNTGEGTLVVVLQETDGTKTEVKRVEGGLASILRTARTLVDGLAETYGIEFDAFDLSEVKTYDDFERKARSLRWPEREVPTDE